MNYILQQQNKDNYDEINTLLCFTESPFYVSDRCKMQILLLITNSFQLLNLGTRELQT